MNTTEQTTPYCNIITPPSKPDELYPSVLIIDASLSDVEDVVLWCKTDKSRSFNIYLYTDTMWELDWFGEIVACVDHIIVNTEDGALTPVKNKLCGEERTWYYGPLKFAGSDRRIERPIDFFKSKENE